MKYIDAFKEGFGLINRNWQLVAIQTVVLIINCLGFFFVVALPIIIAVIMTGTEIENFPDIRELPHAFSRYLTEYFVLFLVGLFFLLVYIVVVSILAIFMYAGSSGVIAHGIRNPLEKFSLKRFFSEGKRLFFPILWYLTVVGLLLTVLFLIGVLVFASIVFFVDYFKEMDTTLGLFVGMFLMLFSAATALFVITFALAATFYGTGVLIFKGAGAFASIKEAVACLYGNPSAYWLYCILFVGSVAVSLLLMLAGIPFNMIPLVGPILSLPYQLFVYVVQSYFGFFIIAVIFLYYFRSEIDRADRPVPTDDIYRSGPYEQV